MKKTTLIAVAVFGALALTLLLTREPQVSEGVRRLTLVPVNGDAIAAVDVGPVTLQQVDGGWTVSSSGKVYAADPAQAQSLVRELVDLKAPDLVSTRAESHGPYEVDASKGVAVKAHTNSGVVRDLVVGKTSKTRGAYLRQAGSDDVFTTPGNLGYLAHLSVRDWRDKHVPTAALTDVARVQVQLATRGAFALVRDDSGWKVDGTLPEGFHFDADAAQRLANQVTAFSAQDFSDATQVDAASTVTLSLKSGATKVLQVGSKQADGTHLLRVDGEAQTWAVPTWQAEALLKGLDAVRDLKLLRVDAKDVEQLTVFGSKGRAVVKRDGATWKLVEPKTPPAGFDFDAQQVDGVLARVLALRGTRVGDAKTTASAPLVELTMKGKVVTLRTGAVEGGEVAVKGRDELVQLLPANQKSWLETGVELFKRPKMPPPGSGQIQGLDQLPPDVRAKLEAQLRAQGH